MLLFINAIIYYKLHYDGVLIIEESFSQSDTSIGFFEVDLLLDKTQTLASDFSLRRFVCRIETNETDRNLILKSRLYTVRHLNFQSGVNTSYKYIVAQSDLSTVRCTLNTC